MILTTMDNINTSFSAKISEFYRNLTMSRFNHHIRSSFPRP